MRLYALLALLFAVPAARAQDAGSTNIILVSVLVVLIAVLVWYKRFGSRPKRKRGPSREEHPKHEEKRSEHVREKRREGGFFSRFSRPKKKPGKEDEQKPKTFFDKEEEVIETQRPEKGEEPMAMDAKAEEDRNPEKTEPEQATARTDTVAEAKKMDKGRKVVLKAELKFKDEISGRHYYDLTDDTGTVLGYSEKRLKGRTIHGTIEKFMGDSVAVHIEKAE